MTTAAIATLITLGITVVGSVVMLLMVNYLPDSPLQSLLTSSEIGLSFWNYAANLAWFLPVAEMLSVIEIWVVIMFEIVIFKIVYELIGKAIGSG